ncbi:hypothetical protein RIF25_07015 [Thermosynechococcaceae cyanobacterium BACA0444]|uniref:Uncharacterized protein n=1 Tax=Pseudocalidococcus azoricus BACA0444 TaxID=2918990 RepID=A0AAE4FRW0_9CYAN|nr:hypothetical protein [Pseudocalidococcus azoricus]MDS3860559.1 hypothetical protein [Pseudocalidococcus azoricus BACA0444]
MSPTDSQLLVFEAYQAIDIIFRDTFYPQSGTWFVWLSLPGSPVVAIRPNGRVSFPRVK